MKDGEIWFQEQAAKFPIVEEGVHDFNPMGCQKGACWDQMRTGSSLLRWRLTFTDVPHLKRWRTSMVPVMKITAAANTPPAISTHSRPDVPPASSGTRAAFGPIMIEALSVRPVLCVQHTNCIGCRVGESRSLPRGSCDRQLTTIYDAAGLRQQMASTACCHSPRLLLRLLSNVTWSGGVSSRSWVIVFGNGGPGGDRTRDHRIERLRRM